MDVQPFRSSASNRLDIVVNGVVTILFLVVLAMLYNLVCTAVAHAQTPESAKRYRADLTRIAHAEWGLDAPIAVFAAQIHQESGWNPSAVSQVGAQGLTQFMPATAKWWCQVSGTPSSQCSPSNPVWAMRALVGYDRWIYARVWGGSEFDRMWAALRGYNGGLGHWQAEARIAGSAGRVAVDAACGQARRAKAFCTENLGYPRRILLTIQPRYLLWGRGLSA